jgi:ribosomal protein S18 acetylase RimI-like enzyme
VNVVSGDRIGAGEYRRLRRDAGWSEVDAPDQALEAALARSWNVTARTDGGELAGMGRLIEDGLMYASIWDMIVARDYRRRGIGTAVLDALMRRGSGRTLVALVATPDGAPLYRRAGFAAVSRGSAGMVWRPG